jgi:hypothetical protein
MKKLVVVLVALGLAFGASAQRSKGSGSTHPAPSKRVVIVRSYSPFSPYFGYGWGSPFYGYSPYNAYSPFGYGFNNGYRYDRRPTKLDLQVEDIQNDFQDRITSVRHDDDLSRKEKRKKVQELKDARERAITEAKKNYYKTDLKTPKTEEKADVSA